MNLNRKSDKIISYLVNAYIFIFVFTMINRELLLFSLDLRYPLVALGCCLVGYSLFNSIKQKKKIKIDRLSALVIFFYIVCFFSNIMWIKGDIKIDLAVFSNVLLLYIFNFISVLVILLYREKISEKYVYRSIMISGTILLISMILVGLGFNLNEIMGGDYAGKVAGNMHKNFFGYNIRLAGYAQDANYASVFMVIWGTTSIKYVKNKTGKFAFCVLAILGLMLSASKTILLGVLVGIVMVGILNIGDKKNEKLYKLVKSLFVVLIISGPYIAIKIFETINYSGSIQTMSTRFKMWGYAVELFESNFLLGHGLTSVRSYFEASPNGWYVQCHSSIFQIMSENGIIALGIFAIIIWIILSSRNKYLVFLTSVFCVFSLTSELIYLSLFVFMVMLLPLILEKRCNHKIGIDDKKVLFIVNSLGKGGAERVVVNIANKMVTLNYKVTIISLYNKQFYKVNEGIDLIILNKNENESKIKKILSIPINAYKVNMIINRLEKDYKFGLITSHLPLSNIICKISKFNDRCIHVIHNVYSAIEGNHKIILSIVLKILYDNCKISAVSSGVERELVERYGVKTKFLTTIYNPIDIDNIQNLAKEEIEEKEKYILFCGRLTSIKRPDVIISAFVEGEFYQNYKLIILGDGELREELEEQCRKLRISNRVIFRGWESNVYRYMRNSSLLVSCSEFEALPMNLLEAFCCGARVVSTDCNYGPREILLGEYQKYLVKENDLEELVLTIRDALNNYPKDGLRLVEKFDTINIINKYMNTSLEWINQTKENRYFEYIKE